MNAVNDSTSQTSPDWPTRWPKSSFSPLWTAGFIVLLVWVAVVVFLVMAFASFVWLAATHHQGELLAAARNPANASAPVFITSTVAQLVAEAVVVAIILVGLPRLTHLSLRALGFRPLSASAFGYALVGALGMVLIADVGSTIIQNYTHAIHPQLVERIFEHIRSQAVASAYFIAFAVVLQPIAEEMIFRVLIFNIVLRWGGFWPAALVSGALFGYLHVLSHDADAVSGVLLAISGVVLCWVYYRSKNAYASMISHGLFNAVSTAALYFAPKIAGG
jgi:membrane protease YdiL (CAAX protease family)